MNDTLSVSLTVLVILGSAFFLYSKLRRGQKELRALVQKAGERDSKGGEKLQKLEKSVKDRASKTQDQLDTIGAQTGEIADLRVTLSEMPEVVSNVRYLKAHRVQSVPSIAKVGGHWMMDGPQLPAPHLIKQGNIKRLAKAYGCSVLVETGTFKGYMVDAMLPYFEQIYSIELSDDLYAEVVKKFADQPQVKLLHGDSGDKIPEVVAELTKPTLFWLDGHYSGSITATADLETPIIAELRHIFDAPDPGHAIMIDDAREFNGLSDYPKLDSLEKFVKEQRPNHTFSVVDDAIWILPA